MPLIKYEHLKENSPMPLEIL